MTETPNDRLNAIVVRGLLAIALLLTGGCVAIYLYRGTIVNELVMLVNSIASGLIGYLAREFKPPAATVPPVSAPAFAPGTAPGPPQFAVAPPVLPPHESG